MAIGLVSFLVTATAWITAIKTAPSDYDNWESGLIVTLMLGGLFFTGYCLGRSDNHYYHFRKEVKDAEGD